MQKYIFLHFCSNVMVRAGAGLVREDCLRLRREESVGDVITSQLRHNVFNNLEFRCNSISIFKTHPFGFGQVSTLLGLDAMLFPF